MRSVEIQNRSARHNYSIEDIPIFYPKAHSENLIQIKEESLIIFTGWKIWTIWVYRNNGPFKNADSYPYFPFQRLFHTKNYCPLN